MWAEIWGGPREGSLRVCLQNGGLLHHRVYTDFKFRTRRALWIASLPLALNRRHLHIDSREEVFRVFTMLHYN